MNERIELELTLLRHYYPDLEYREEGQWVLLPHFPLPEGIWNAEKVSVCFQILDTYPGQPPYGFYVSPRIRLQNGNVPDRYTDSSEPPFSDEWGKFSWSMVEWRATGNLQSGSNLLNFVLSFTARLKEGA